jgi:hypothetical protein
LKEEALDHPLWRIHCGRGCELVARQNTQWTSECKIYIYLLAITNKPLQMEPNHTVSCEIWGSYGTVYEDDCLLGCDVHSGRQAPPFWRNMLPLCSWQSWRWRQCTPQKHWYLTTELHGITPDNKVISVL